MTFEWVRAAIRRRVENRFGRVAESRRSLKLPQWLVFVVIAAVLCGCTAEPSQPLEHEAYVWQRQWTPALASSIDAMSNDFAGWRVLAAESTTAGDLIDASPDLGLLARGGKQVIAVLRLNGSRPPPSAEAIAKRVDDIASAWRGAGVVLSGIEIDHDCATVQLDAYATLLAQLHQRLPDGLRLSITALPTWIGAPALARVLAQVDASVLQVHAIAAPRAGQGETGLFDAAQAQRWIDAYAAVASKPFRVALPAYGVRVGFDDDGRALAVEGEMPRAIDSDRKRELRVDPVEVAALLRRLERAHPAQLTSVLWFRLPSEDDRRSWSVATLHSVIAGAPLKSDFAARTSAADDGATEIVLANRGTLDAPLAVSVTIAAKNCSAADALAGFRADRTSEGWQFFPDADAILRAGHERRIGWARCASIEGISIHAHP